MNNIETAIVMLIKHIRPDGYIYPFSLEETQLLQEIAKNIQEVKDGQLHINYNFPTMKGVDLRKEVKADADSD